MSGGANEVEASVYSGVVGGDEGAPDLELLLQVVVELLVNVVHDGGEAVGLVNLVPVANRVHHRQLNNK